MPLHLQGDYRGYLMTDDYGGYNALALQPDIECLACMAHVRRKFVDAQKVQPKGKEGRADVALTMINTLYGLERDFKDANNDEQQFVARQEKSLPLLARLKSWLEKTQQHVTAQSALGTIAKLVALKRNAPCLALQKKDRSMTGLFVNFHIIS